ncbi:hypothetical protein GF358_01865 [Candidatus Woesearchaeota archaeon]|nr:hypothetical protein [Candidatus Woesearchaeota archaeon]
MEKNSYMLFGLVAVIAVVGLVTMYNAVPSGQVAVMSAKVYGGATKGIEMPYYKDRVVLVNKGDSVKVMDLSKVEDRVPSQSALENREPQRAIGLLDSCEGLIIQDQAPKGYIYEAGWNDMKYRYGANNCVDMTAWIGQYCCKQK